MTDTTPEEQAEIRAQSRIWETSPMSGNEPETIRAWTTGIQPINSNSGLWCDDPSIDAPEFVRTDKAQADLQAAVAAALEGAAKKAEDLVRDGVTFQAIKPNGEEKLRFDPSEVMREIRGVVRLAAKDIRAMIPTDHLAALKAAVVEAEKRGYERGLREAAGSADKSDLDALLDNFRSAIMQGVIRSLHEKPRTYRQLVWDIYQGNEPDRAVNCLYVTICRERHKLRAVGWDIDPPGQGAGERVLRLVKIEKAPPA